MESGRDVPPDERFSMLDELFRWSGSAGRSRGANQERDGTAHMMRHICGSCGRTSHDSVLQLTVRWTTRKVQV